MTSAVSPLTLYAIDHHNIVKKKDIPKICQIVANETMQHGICNKLFYLVRKVYQFCKGFIPCVKTERREAMSLIHSSWRNQPGSGSIIDHTPISCTRTVAAPILTHHERILKLLIKTNNSFLSDSLTPLKEQWIAAELDAASKDLSAYYEGREPIPGVKLV